MPTDVSRPDVPERFIVDNSVWQRQRDPAVRGAMDVLMARHSPWAFLLCPPVAAEVGFSARSGSDHTALRRALEAFPECEQHPSASIVLGLQNALFTRGLLRAVGATDTVIAAYALVNEAMVLHYDSDFQHIATVEPSFRHRWITPRGSVA